MSGRRCVLLSSRSLVLEVYSSQKLTSGRYCLLTHQSSWSAAERTSNYFTTVLVLFPTSPIAILVLTHLHTY
ncbi:hypothetical protein BDQ12DRAFT_139533 [Crucibulum laeve]|uniref:Uncharacterized protein n=1 Tax=Crucibulum laeve TaxID=68775 RepID=A0A5C3LXW9_9AGAR|nr:hypothetical protein BDQ12DRAFT_139533 [Crucibulum laeve]